MNPPEPTAPDSVLSFSHSGSSYALPLHSQQYPRLASPGSLIFTGPRYRSTPIPYLYGPLTPLIREATGDVAPFMVHIPLSASYLYNWKIISPPFPDKPQGLISFLRHFFTLTSLPGMTANSSKLSSTSDERDREDPERSREIHSL